MVLDTVIFDMDGVIADTEIIESQSLEKLLKEYGKTPQYQKNGLIHIIGLAGDKSWIDFKEKYELSDNISILRNRKREIFEQIIKQELKPPNKKYVRPPEVASSEFLYKVLSKYNP